MALNDNTEENTINIDDPDLLAIGIFSRASAVTLNRLARTCVRRQYAAGKTILSHGDGNSDVMLLFRGEVVVKVFSPGGREVAIRTILAGEIFGDYSAIDSQARSANVIAQTDVTVGYVSAPEFLNLITTDSQVAQAQMVDLVGMIRLLTQRLYEQTTLRASERLRQTLLRMASVSDAKSNTAVIDQFPTHANLAALIGSQRHVVTTELHRLETEGLVTRNGKGATIPDVAALGKFL